MKVLEPNDLGEPDGPFLTGERARLVLKAHRAEVEERPFFQIVGPVVSPENATFAHGGVPPLSDASTEGLLLKAMVPELARRPVPGARPLGRRADAGIADRR